MPSGRMRTALMSNREEQDRLREDLALLRDLLRAAEELDDRMLAWAVRAVGRERARQLAELQSRAYRRGVANGEHAEDETPPS